MITEDYVSFDTAKLLKEKGFDWLESPFYSEQDRDEWRQKNSYTVPNEEYNPELPFDSETLTMVAPHISLQMAMKWLREEHNLFVFPFPQMNTDKFWVEIYQLSNNREWINLYCETIDLQDYSSYEDACEAAIKYCLENLI